MRIFLTLLRHESCGSACLVDSECSFPPYLLSVLQYHLRVRSCLYALAIFFFLIVSPADFLDSSACKLVYLLLSLLFFSVPRRCLLQHVLVRGCPCGALRILSRYSVVWQWSCTV